ncbi:MAG: hypothetical protein BGO69_16770 [Bacteroidetes bacterium 46-16]|nr:MAG: hypothetical protein BGO69_16770 [Bacteroidetes bacterium 46-16]
MDLYIYRAGLVSAAGDNSGEQFLANAPSYHTDRLLCDELDYTAYIPPMQLRRMSKAVRMSVAAAKICMRQDEKAAAISVGTGMGCLYDTEQFLSKMVTQNEQMLTPTSFIQSTHNTVGGQIAMLTGCHGHNLTFVQRGHSFENAVINAGLYLDEHPGEKILTGGFDELTNTSLAILKTAGVYSIEPRGPENVLHHTRPGGIAGEGASFLLMGKEPMPGSLAIRGLSLFVTKDTADALQQVTSFLQAQALEPGDISFAMLGTNGDGKYEPFYKALRQDVFKDCSTAVFKHLSGEYPTAGSFALALLYCMTSQNLFPAFLFNDTMPGKVKHIVLVNNYVNHYTCWHLEVV